MSKQIASVFIFLSVPPYSRNKLKSVTIKLPKQTKVKVIVTVKSSGFLQIGFWLLIIENIHNILFDPPPPSTPVIRIVKFNVAQKAVYFAQNAVFFAKKECMFKKDTSGCFAYIIFTESFFAILPRPNGKW